MSRRTRFAADGPASWIAFLALVLGCASTSAAQVVPPRLQSVDGVLVLSRLPPVLGDEEVRRHLGTGLTTTLALRLEVRGQVRDQVRDQVQDRIRDPGRGQVRGQGRGQGQGQGRGQGQGEVQGSAVRREGGAVATVRFDLWDEVFHVAWVGAAGGPERRVATTFDELEAWWRELRLAVLTVPGGGRPEQARLVIEVVPFSAAEARDTQRWFSDTLDDAKTSSAEDGSVEDGSDGLGRAFRLLMATSIQRRAVRVFRYEPEISPAGDGP